MGLSLGLGRREGRLRRGVSFTMMLTVGCTGWEKEDAGVGVLLESEMVMLTVCGTFEGCEKLDETAGWVKLIWAGWVKLIWTGWTKLIWGWT